MNFNKILNIKYYLNNFFSLNFNEQAKAIIENEKSINIIKDLPTQYIALIIKKVGINDCLEILELLSAKQIKEIMDFEIWEKDRINSVNLGYWFHALFISNPKFAIQKFHNLDIEIVLFILKSNLIAYELFDEQNLPEISGIHIVTPDCKYVIEFYGSKEKESLLIFLKSYIGNLYENNAQYASFLIESIKWELTSSLEEEAYHLKNSRLADIGFDDFTRSLSLLSYIDPEKTLLEIKKNIKYKIKTVKKYDNLPRVIFIKSFNKYKTFKDTFLILNDVEKKILIKEIYIIINNIQIALGQSPINYDTLTKASNFTLSSIDIALNYFNKKNENSSIHYLKTYNAKKIFKIGYSLTLEPKKYWHTLEKIYPEIFNKKSIKYFDYPINNIILGLTMKRPLFFSGLTDPRKLEFNTFKNLKEINLTKNALLEASFQIYLIRIGLKHKLNKDDITCSQLLSTYLCWYLLGEKPKCKRFNKASLIKLLKKFIKIDDKYSLPSKYKEKSILLIEEIIYSIFPVIGIMNTEEALRRSKKYVLKALSEIENELSELSVNNVKPKFIKSILI